MTAVVTSRTQAGPFVVEPSPRWVRAEAGGVTVVDSKRVLLLWEEGKVLPVYLFPRDDVRADLLRPSEDPRPEEHHSFASYWTLEIDGRVTESAAWTYSPPQDERLAGYVVFAWNAMDAWYEEEERVLGHPRDPYHRVDLRESSRHVLVSLDGETVAETRRPRLVFETGLPSRYYFPREDVRMDLLSSTETRTLCAYKGEACYWSATVKGELHEDVAWTYPEPLPDSLQFRDLVCFLNEQADIYVDEELLERPTTQWSKESRSSSRGSGSE